MRTAPLSPKPSNLALSPGKDTTAAARLRSYTRHAAASLLPCHGLTLPSCRLLSCLFMPADMAANSFGPNIIIGRLALIAIQLPIHKPRENNWLAPCAQARAHQQALWLVRALFFCFLQLNCTSITAKKSISLSHWDKPEKQRAAGSDLSVISLSRLKNAGV